MFLFKKKKKAQINIESKFHIKEFVSFRYKDDLKCGSIVGISLDPDTKEILYEIQVGGECPIVIKNIKEEKIFRS